MAPLRSREGVHGLLAPEWLPALRLSVILPAGEAGGLFPGSARTERGARQFAAARDRVYSRNVCGGERAVRSTFLDLRNKTRGILRALARNERITIFYPGRPETGMPLIHGRQEGAERSRDEHQPAVGMWKGRVDLADVRGHVRPLRKG